MLNKTLVYAIAIIASTFSAKALTLGQFRDCVSASGASLGYSTTCTLDPGTYNIDNTNESPITIGRSGITVDGYVSDRTQVKLIRMNTGVDNLMNLAAGVNHIIIQGFTFDGNKYTYSVFNDQLIDMNADGLTYWITVQSCAFKNSQYPILTSTYTTIITACTFDRSGAIFTTSNNNNSFSYQYVENSTFDTDSESVVVFNNVQYGYILNNIISSPYSIAMNNSHGTLVLELPNSNITIEDNAMDGGNQVSTNGNGSTTSGIEGYGSYHYINGNTIANYSAQGIYYAGADHITLSVDGSSVGNWINNNGKTDTNPGVEFLNLYNGTSTYCHTSNISVYALDADNNSQYGMHVWSYPTSSCGTSITAVSVTSSQFCNNPSPSSSGGLAFDSTVSSPTTSGNSCQ